MLGKALSSKGWKRLGLWVAIGLVLVPLGALVFRRSASAQEQIEREPHAPRPRPGDCTRATRLVPADDPCPVLEQVHAVLQKLSPSAVEYVQNVASGFNLEGNVRIQQALLREDLVWQQRGLTPRQLDVMVFVAVGLSLQDADALAKELRNNMDSEADPDAERRLERVNLFRVQALALLGQLGAELKDVSNAELRFSF